MIFYKMIFHINIFKKKVNMTIQNISYFFKREILEGKKQKIQQLFLRN